MINAFLYPFSSITWLAKRELRNAVLIPLLINVVLFVALAWLGSHYFDVFLNQWLPADAGWAWLRPLLWLLAVMMFLVMGFFSFTIVGNLIASPFNALLAARTELLMTGEASERLSQLFAVVAKEAIGSELFKLRYLIVRLIPLLILTLITSWIPMINLFVSSLWLVFGAWFLVIEYADYPMANNQLNAKEQLNKLKSKRLRSLSFGAGTSVLMMFLGPLAMPSATIGATRYWVNQLKD